MQTLTRKEEQIMQAVWQIGHPCLISEILKKDVTLKRNTVAPGIITLTKKGYLKVDSIGKSMTRTGRAYAPLIDQHAYNEQKKLRYLEFLTMKKKHRRRVRSCGRADHASRYF